MISWQAQCFWKILQFSRTSRGKHSFWKSGSSIFANVSQDLLVLEVRIFSFRRSLAENARFGSLAIFNFCECLAEFARFGSPDLQWKSPRKRSFSKVWIFIEGGRLAENAPFRSDRSDRIKNATAVTAYNGCYHSHRQSPMNVTTVIVSRM